MVLLTSVFNFLKKRNFYIYLLTFDIYRPLFEDDDRLKGVFFVEKDANFIKFLKFIFCLRKKFYFDFVVDMHFKLRSLIPLFLVRGSRKNFIRKKWFLRRLFLKFKKNFVFPSYVDFYKNVLEKILGLRIKEKFFPSLKINFSGFDYKFSFPRPYVLFNLGAKHFSRKWFSNIDFNEVINLLKKKGFLSVFVSDCFEDLKVGINLTGKTSLKEFIYLIKNSALVVTGDSAAVHIASAYNKKQLVIYTNTPIFWGFQPLSKVYEVIYPPVSCYPCSLHGRNKCPRNFECLNHITTHLLIEKIEKLL